MRVCAAILAAGSGARFGGDKTVALLGGKPVWRWSVDAFCSHPRVSRVVVICGAQNEPQIRSSTPEGVSVLRGGDTRQASSRIALDACEGFDVLIVHDAARPFVSADLIDRVLDAIERNGAAAPGVAVADTIRQQLAGGLSIVERAGLSAMQTPQGARHELLARAHGAATVEATDDMALLEEIGVEWELVAGDPNNFKITTPADLLRARQAVGLETRTGIGYDVHPFAPDPARQLWLGGVQFEDHPGLEGHSDADVLLHAAVDAILGAAALGDIGQHFPNTDPRWKGEPSITFLKHAAALVADAGWSIVNLDLTAIAETPKIMKKADAIRQTMASALGIETGRVSVKATTNERLGSIGRGEGIAAFAIATLCQNR